MELETDHLTSRILFLKASSYKCQFYPKVCASSRLISQVQVMTGQNINKKYLMCQIPIKMLKQLFPNSSLQNWKISASCFRVFPLLVTMMQKSNSIHYKICSNRFSPDTLNQKYRSSHRRCSWKRCSWKVRKIHRTSGK